MEDLIFSPSPEYMETADLGLDDLEVSSVGDDGDETRADGF